MRATMARHWLMLLPLYYTDGQMSIDLEITHKSFGQGRAGRTIGIFSILGGHLVGGVSRRRFLVSFFFRVKVRYLVGKVQEGIDI